MKIIHCADLHLDSKMTANLTREQARERKKEMIRHYHLLVNAIHGRREQQLFDAFHLSVL